ncbi:MAG: hypothetical protein QNJ97_18600 [Myxococcota bacterium]|nr:hypothetical protein [Myxococcota bacterium]
MTDCPSRFSLMQWHVGEVPAAERAALSGHIDTCQACKAVIAEFEADERICRDRRDVNLQNIRARLNTDQQRRPSAGQRLPFRWRMLIPAFGAAAAVIAGVFMTVSYQPPAETIPDHAQIRFKGTIAMQVNADRTGHGFEVEPTTHLIAGDVLRFAVTTSTPGYLAILQIDDHGGVATVFPMGDPPPAVEPSRIPSAGRRQLHSRVTIDDRKGRVLFIAVFFKDIFQVADIVSQIGTKVGTPPTLIDLEQGIDLEPYATTVLGVDKN